MYVVSDFGRQFSRMNIQAGASPFPKKHCKGRGKQDVAL